MFRIPLIRPFVPPDAAARLAEVLDSGMWTEGAVTRAFEEAVAAWLGVGRVLAVTSATTGLEAALRALGVGPGDEVLVPDYTYPATASAARLVGADVVLVDVDPHAMRVTPEALLAAAGPRTKAAMPVSLFGMPFAPDAFEALRARGIAVVEDAACTIGARSHGVATGHGADVTVFSLHPRKLLTTGEGGLVCARDPALLDWLDSYKHFGMEPGANPPRFVRTGTNLKLSNLLAAVGLAQLPHLPGLLAARRERAERYRRLLGGLPAVRVSEVPAGAEPTWQTFCVQVPGRARILAELRAEGIEVQIGSYALHRQPAFADDPGVRRAGDLAGSAHADDHALALPLHAALTDAEQDEVVEALAKRLPA